MQAALMGERWKVLPPRAPALCGSSSAAHGRQGFVAPQDQPPAPNRSSSWNVRRPSERKAAPATVGSRPDLALTGVDFSAAARAAEPAAVRHVPPHEQHLAQLPLATLHHPTSAIRARLARRLYFHPRACTRRSVARRRADATLPSSGSRNLVRPNQAEAPSAQGPLDAQAREALRVRGRLGCSCAAADQARRPRRRRQVHRVDARARRAAHLPPGGVPTHGRSATEGRPAGRTAGMWEDDAGGSDCRGAFPWTGQEVGELMRCCRNWGARSSPSRRRPSSRACLESRRRRSEKRSRKRPCVPQALLVELQGTETSYAETRAVHPLHRRD